jgi:hypothetical protein
VVSPDEILFEMCDAPLQRFAIGVRRILVSLFDRTQRVAKARSPGVALRGIHGRGLDVY